MSAPKLYIHVGKAKHFARWEVPQFARHFTIVDSPSESVPLLSFGPDVFEEAAMLPASHRFAVLFPGFSYNPLRNLQLRERQRALIEDKFTQIFINPGPLEIAYRGFPKISLYDFSVDLELITMKRYRTSLDTLLHVSQDNPQKDWRRSESIMVKTGLRHEVYPPRDQGLLTRHVRRLERNNALRRVTGIRGVDILPVGYFSHKETIAKYQQFDGFVHVARDVRHPEFIDGMFTATLMEAGATGAILFWHDTWGLGTKLETVFQLPLDTADAAERILDIRSSINVEEHSRQTREEMIETFSPIRSVAFRADVIRRYLD